MRGVCDQRVPALRPVGDQQQQASCFLCHDEEAVS
jgi:hypothetical protein